MENLVGRARSIMNLMLVGLVILIWAIPANGRDAIDIVSRIYNLLESTYVASSDQNGLTVGRGFVIDVRVALEIHDGSLRSAVSSIPLEKVESVLTELQGKPPLRKLSETDQEKLSDFIEMFRVSDSGLDEEISVGTITSFLSLPLDQLAQQYWNMRSQVAMGNGATVGLLNEKLEAKIKLPMVDQYVNSTNAVIVIAAGYTVGLLLLVSVVSTMRQECQFATDRKGIDWIFFHSSWLGPVVGGIWVLSPAVYLACFGPQSMNLASRALFSLVLLVLAAIAIKSSLDARQDFVRALRAIDSNGSPGSH